MSVFWVALRSVLQMLLYMLPGYLVVRFKKLSLDAMPGMSSILVYVFSTCLVVSSFLKMDFSWALFGRLWLVFFVSLGLQLLFVGLLLLIYHSRRGENACRVMCVASGMGNAGFMGLPLLAAILPNSPEVSAYACIYCVTMDVVMFTVGVYGFTNDRKTISPKGFLLNPAIVACFIGMLLFVLRGNEVIPQLVINAVSVLGSMCTPFSMLILGGRSANETPRELVANAFTWRTVFYKLLAFPLMCCAILWFIPMDAAMRFSLMFLSAMPCASIVSSMAELHHTEQGLAANTVLVTTLLSLISIPLLSMLMSLSLS